MAVARPCLDLHAVADLRVGDRVAHKVAQYLCEPVGVGVERAVDGVQAEVALAEKRQVAAEVLEEVGELDRAWLDELAGLGTGECEHVGDEPVELVEAVQQRHGAFVAARLVALAVEQLDLGAKYRERGPELVGGVGDEVALALERALEPVEHMVEGVGQQSHLSTRMRRPGACREVACLDRCGDSDHPPQRRCDQGCERNSGGDRQRERDQPHDQKGVAHARLRLLHRGERVGDAQCPDALAAGIDRVCEHAHAAGLRDRQRRDSRRGVEQPRRLTPAVLACLLADDDLRVVADRAAAAWLDDDDQRLGVIALRREEPSARVLQRGGRRDVRGRGELAPFRLLGLQLGIDLGLQARTRAVVEGQEAGGDREHGDERDRHRELRAQATGKRATYSRGTRSR